MLRRILIFANKSWEADPLVGVFSNPDARPSKLPPFDRPFDPAPQVTVPLNDGTTKQVSARLALRTANATAELWCVKDLMDPAKKSSSSEEKARVIPAVVANGPAPTLVVAFGTASFPGDRSFNGCAVVGTQVFVHNPHKTPNPESNWVSPEFDKLLVPTAPAPGSALSILDRDLRRPCESRFLSPPLNPANPPALLVASDYVALSDVNVTKPEDYVWADRESIQAMQQAGVNAPVGSMETTHGVIRLAAPSEQFLFFSGIANRLGYFDSEVTPRAYAQNFAASHNAGIALAHALPLLMV
ncbi:hypothetical protein KXD96_05565 [Mycobacterium sp. SMC-2]|uniref:hypothetical protein n=1 Tax=Mycobacterium sp. SMC-2 TaxID=2857058 RepID=UPI0021B3CB48|nr:hypothetical protein [Mycobacterium sp. SMC-2]UXA07592.1 hypothetical protein KXD96_05565 [Mycobacterium sp. SMC-2]